MNLEIENYSSYETLSVTFVKDGTAFERSDLDNASMNNVAVLIFMDSPLLSESDRTKNRSCAR